MRAAWWWIDKWRQSTAFTDMTAEEQGLARNLWDELWLREDHVIPDDPRILARASGDPDAWARSGAKVLRWMRRVDGGWTNDTALEVIQQAERRAAKQKSYRERRGNGTGNAPGNDTGNKPGSLSLSLSLTDITPQRNPPNPPARAGGDPPNKRTIAGAASKRLVARARAAGLVLDLAAARRMQRELKAGVRSEEEIAESIDAEAAAQAQRREESREQEAAVNWLHERGGMEGATAELAAWLSEHQEPSESRLEAGHRWREECGVPPYVLAAVLPRLPGAAVERAHSPPEDARA